MDAVPVAGSPRQSSSPLSPLGRRILWIVVMPFIPVVLAFAAGGALLIMLVVLHIGRVYSLPTDAMSPTLSKGDSFFASLVSYRHDHPKRGDVACFSSRGLTELGNLNHGADPIYVKRVVGLPGETIFLHAGHLMINGKLAPELADLHFEPAPGGSNLTADDETFVVPADSYYLLGDNSHNSRDSRYWGCVPSANFCGRVLFRFWPPNRIGLIN